MLTIFQWLGITRLIESKIKEYEEAERMKLHHMLGLGGKDDG
jgi:hypothetical protein